MTVTADETKWLTFVGEILRAQRIAQGIEIEAVAQATKIGKSQLLAIEEADVGKLPAMAYVRGFVRVYASFLGVAPGELRLPAALLAEQCAQPGNEVVSAANSEKVRWGKRWFAPIMLGISVVVLAYIYQPDRVSPVPSPAVPETAQQPVAAVLAPVSTVRQAALPIGQSLPDKQPVEAVPVADGAILKLKVNQDCWLNITIDGAISQQYDLKSGDLIEWKAKESIALDLGNAGGVEGIFNGKPLDPFGETGKVAHVLLKSDGSKDGMAARP